MAQFNRFNEMHVAYFSMEIGVDENVPTYSGGLGILAGDTLRSMADMKVPVIAITLLYKKGYFKQTIDSDGNQHEEDINWDPNSVLQKLDQTVSVKIEGREIKISAWIYELKGVTGHVNPIILLDTNVEGNTDEDKNLTRHLYSGDLKNRLAQEIILGIGGTRMLRAIHCNNLRRYHMNERHSALLTLELEREIKQKKGDVQIHDVRELCVFTTHTPVPAGHDQFPKEMAESMLGDFITDHMRKHMYFEDKLNMTYLGLRYSEFINGVAKKHGEVSRTMFPGYHIESITNGVHSAFWTSEPFKELFNEFVPSWQNDAFSLRYILGVSKEKIWNAHMKAKQILVDFVNSKYKSNMNTEDFTLGFARRAATYKRNDLLFQDIERLMRIADKFDGFQIIFAGKAHPNDQAGKDMIRNIVQAMKKIKNKIKVCYIEDYNIKIAKTLIPGVDLWLNTPMRPYEASGTSGMKAAHNGVPQFSTLDGWWLEGHIENVTGWSIGIHPHDSQEVDPKKDIEDLYTKLEYVILPKFYNERDDWIAIMQHSIALNGSFFNTTRMVQQYVLNAYYL